MSGFDAVLDTLMQGIPVPLGERPKSPNEHAALGNLIRPPQFLQAYGKGWHRYYH